MNRAALESIFHTINVIWPFAKLDIDDEPTREVWWAAVSDIPTSVLGAATTRLARSEERQHPRPGQFRSICHLILEDRARKAQQAEYARSASRVEKRTPKENAWAATQATLARRIIGPGQPMPASGFDTDFDAEYVARSVDISGVRVEGFPFETHKAAFDQLKALFEREWTRLHGSEPVEDFA